MAVARFRPIGRGRGVACDRRSKRALSAKASLQADCGRLGEFEQGNAVGGDAGEVETVHSSPTCPEKEDDALQPVEVAVTENKSVWHLMDSAPDEVSREQPVILLVHSINVSPERDSPFWLPVIGYRTKEDGWKAVVNDAGLVPIYWTEIPTPLPPKGLPPA
jgi:hypothetical protein